MEIATTKDARLFKDFKTYLVRWLVFGFIAGALFQPVTENLDQFWTVKLYQALSGLPFGLACGVVFTVAQDKFNAIRNRGRSRAIVFATWMGMKFIFFGVAMALGGT